MSEPRATLSSEVFKYWIIDRRAREIRVVFQDGRDVRSPLDDALVAESSRVAVSIFDWEKWWVASVTDRNDVVFSEAYSPHTIDPLRGRQVVYLDQNHWSTVAQAVLDPGRIRKRSEIAPALEIVRLASDAGIVLPLSSAHLRESGPLFGERRYQLGLAMATLAGGWQMRHPIQVWCQEGLRMHAPHFGYPLTKVDTPQVFSLAPRTALSDDVDAHLMAPDDLAPFQLAATAPSVMLELLIDPDPLPAHPVPGWVARQEHLTARILELPKAKRRQAALGVCWVEHLQTVAEVLALRGAAVSSLSDLDAKEVRWLLRGQPMISLAAALFSQRYVSSTTTWKANDLTDLLFLSCAAGYADYVAAEAATGTQLQQLQRSQELRASVHLDLASLVEALHRDGVRTASELGHT